MYKFIKVFSENDKEKMIHLGHELLSSDDKSHVYVFINDNRIQNEFQIDGAMELVMTDTLTF